MESRNGFCKPSRVKAAIIAMNSPTKAPINAFSRGFGRDGR